MGVAPVEAAKWQNRVGQLAVLKTFSWDELLVCLPFLDSPGSAIVRAHLSGTVENGANSGPLSLRFRSEVAGYQVTLVRGSWWQVLQH